MSSPSHHDVVIIGGGVMGCAIALELARSNIGALVLERSVPGAEASSAAAGMLAAQVEAHAPGPFLDLSLASRARFADLATRLRELTDIDVEYRACGVVRVAFSQAELDDMRQCSVWQRELGLDATLIEGTSDPAEKALAPSRAGTLRFALDGRVDPPKYLRALRIGAERAGARFLSGSLVRRIITSEQRAHGIELENGDRISASHVVVAAGSWSGLIDGATIAPGVVRPARGQIVELLTQVPPIRHVVFGSKAYISPRDDGRILVGSTLEFVGFERGVTAGAVRDLLHAAIELVPELARAEVGRTWSSFRPYTADELPLIGPTPLRGLLLATGHYRNGILLSPITAEIVARSIEGSAPPIPIEPFLPRTFVTSLVGSPSRVTPSGNPVG